MSVRALKWILWVVCATLSMACYPMSEVDTNQPVGINYDRIRESQPLLPFILRITKRYGDFKKTLSDRYHIQFSMNASLMPQWGAPRGGSVPIQLHLTPSINWDITQDPEYGKSSIQFFYQYVNYTAAGVNAIHLADDLNIADPINGNKRRANTFSLLTYRYTFPNDWLAIAIGQYSFYNFDRNQYTQNAQINFINYALAQNGSATYANAGLGTFVQINPTNTLTLLGGVQGAENIRGANIQWSNFTHGAHAWFTEAAWTPTLKNLGSTYLAILYYKQPAVVQQPVTTNGFSLSAVQNLNEHWGIFMRANTASESLFNIDRSYVGGVVNNNPLGRDTRDQIGSALAVNRVNPKAFPNTSTGHYEQVLEVYWAWTYFHWFQLTPDVQLYFNPGQSTNQRTAVVYSLRSNIIF